MTTTLVDDLRTARSRGVRPEAPDADLRGAYLRDADLCDADLCGADLRGADLCGADLCGADLRGADLCGADWRGLHIDGLPSGQVTLTPTPEGWDLTIGCWQHKTLADLAALIAGEITPPEARGPEIERRVRRTPALAAKWGQAS
jgi:hypothetical protein